MRVLTDLQRRSFGHNRLTSDEARKIAKAISRIPELMMQRRGFYSRGSGNYRWKPARQYHVALEDSYIRANYDGNQYALQTEWYPIRSYWREDTP